jgi:hypothetical protein
MHFILRVERDLGEPVSYGFLLVIPMLVRIASHSSSPACPADPN